jgi:predicted metal-dependent hydrolase
MVARDNREQIYFAGREVSIRRSRRRRTIGLTVTAAGEVVVAAPVGVSAATLRQALARHRAWLEEKLAARQDAWDRLPPGSVFLQGQAYRLALAPEAAAPVALAGREIRVRAASAAAAWPSLVAWYLRDADRVIRGRVAHYARLMDLKAVPVELKEWQRRWGECHPGKALRFNWRLILLPPEILDYVVVHELAHLIVPGHPPGFWRVVEQTLPDYRPRRQWLNRYGRPFLLWRLA